MLTEHTLFGIEDKIETAIKRLKLYEPKEGYYLAFSGGKDSVTIKKLAELAGVKFDAHYNVTTIDPPELVKFIRQYHPDVIFEKPKKPMLELVKKYGLPLRKHRWCCALYKERGGKGRRVITGVRWEESARRSQRKMVEYCAKDETKTFMNVIIDWTADDVWEFIKAYNVPYCSLYDEGFTRIGCLFCPMASKGRIKQAERYPKFLEAFRKAATYYYNNNCKSERILLCGSGDKYFEWWLYGKKDENEDEDQCVMFE